MDVAAEHGRNPVSKHQIQPEYGDEQADAGRDCRTRLPNPNSQARTRTGKYHFPCSADHEQDWQPYPVDPYSAICDDHTYIHIVAAQAAYRQQCSYSSSSILVQLYVAKILYSIQG